MSRTQTFSNKAKLVAALNDVETGKISRFLKLQLVEKGYVKIEKVRAADGVGRPAHDYRLTGKARGYLALSKNWGKVEKFKKAAPVAVGTALVVWRG